MCPTLIKGMDTVTAVERNRTVHERNLLNSTKGNSPRPCVHAPCLPSRLMRSRLPLRAGLRPALTSSTAQASGSRDAGSGGNRLPLMPCGLAFKNLNADRLHTYAWIAQRRQEVCKTSATVKAWSESVRGAYKLPSERHLSFQGKYSTLWFSGENQWASVPLDRSNANTADRGLPRV